MRPMLFAPALLSAALLGVSLPVRADDSAPPSAPVAPPAPSSARATNGEYVAPLAQETQRTYVPQSVALSGPHEMDWEEGAPVPDGYHPATRVRKGPIIAGSVTFGALYLLSVLTAATAQDIANSSGGSRSNPDAALYVPGVGPFIQMFNTSSAVGDVILAIDGLGQCAGIALLTYGITSPKHVVVRNDLATVRLVPVVAGQGSVGMGLAGTF